MDTVILCGGKGTRSYPYTEHFPKVMMPIGGTPILVHLMHIYAAQGFTSFILAAGHRKEILYDYFSGRFSDWRIRIIDTGENADTGERIRQCAPHASETFFATYGDGLGNVDLGRLLDFHRSKRALATVTTAPLRSQYGVIQHDSDQRVVRFIEKPVISEYWINAGFSYFNGRCSNSFRARIWSPTCCRPCRNPGFSINTSTTNSGDRWTPAKINRSWRRCIAKRTRLGCNSKRPRLPSVRKGLI